MFFFFLLAILLENSTTPTASPWPTSTSGVPKWSTVFITCGAAIAAVLICVLILCFKKSDNSAVVIKMNQGLLEKADV